jgi:hypothetical protein
MKKRIWTRATLWYDGSVQDRNHANATLAKRYAQERSTQLKADVDAMEEATVLATYRSGVAIYEREAVRP